ncbi:MAG: CapA family protein [Deltaproteobacteria bacterium]|nr:CapA family protein [Deltaproteobacteria bacterium]
MGPRPSQIARTLGPYGSLVLALCVATTPSRAGADGVITLGFGGDVAFTHGLDARDPLGALGAMLRAPDLTWVNLETTVGDVGEAAPRQLRFRSPPSTPAILRGAGVDGVALANNHALDFGRAGLVRTMDALDAAGIAHAGAGRDRDASFAPRVQVVRERRVATLAFHRLARRYAWSATDRLAGIASAHGADVERSVAAVRVARRAAEVVIVMAHWGIEGAVCPARFQRDLARRWAEAGADVVVGSHPHVLQGIERIGTTWVIHSTGNLAFPSARREAARSAFFELTFPPRSSRDESGLRARPLELLRGAPRPAGPDAAREIIESLSHRSFGVSLDADGRARALSSHGRGPGRCGDVRTGW